MSRYFLKNSILFIFMLFSYEALPKCIESSIVSPSPFMGNNDEIFKLSDGSSGIQIISATLMDEWREVANC